MVFKAVILNLKKNKTKIYCQKKKENISNDKTQILTCSSLIKIIGYHLGL